MGKFKFMRFIIALILAFCFLKLSSQTRAHEKSQFAVIDPTYNSARPFPESDLKAGAPWLYGETELESWRLQLMRVSSKKGDSAYRFYDRPYGKSLCHAWGAGPVVLLPEIIFGIKPISDGWKKFSVNPCFGLVKWASVTVPTKYGNIVADIDGNLMTLIVPDGATAEWDGKTITGPQRVTLPQK